ncbi:unnamed protein product (macronuclear) [Paramecium tetraurelia]|uniref:Uncharacterized protein n=1 Tax=Paramecium tetraurelia TaxID=5888 RepID=A0C6M3_PARTE|nr:uncharacterized protein GSPATT00035569001 [Paramecium tetraurelia]CAK66440.1 unnamed protein product [Paramecium tetraurelia]|eukprot:XP_001433837.1 hypothetical protein (macronuclear) [Paramecium tetraurelia strain d4-2]
MINCQQNQRQNFSYVVCRYNREQRSTSVKVERLKQINILNEIKQDYQKGLQLGRMRENALRIINMKLEKNRLRKKSLETKTEVEEEHFPQINQVLKPPLPYRSILVNKENTIQMPSILQKQMGVTKQIQIKARRLSQRIRMKNSEPTIEFSPWENQENQEFDFI